MATTHVYDLTVVTGEYQDRSGQTKKRYKNIGRVLRNDNGMFAVMDKTFNPAGVPSDGDTIFISMFEPRQRDGQQQQSNGYGAGGQPSNHDTGGDEIPFNKEWR